MPSTRRRVAPRARPKWAWTFGCEPEFRFRLWAWPQPRHADGPAGQDVDGARASILGFESRDRPQACSRARGVRPRVTVIQEGRDATVREIDTDSSNPARSASLASRDILLALFGRDGTRQNADICGHSSEPRAPARKPISGLTQPNHARFGTDVSSSIDQRVTGGLKGLGLRKPRSGGVSTYRTFWFSCALPAFTYFA
jgi:hypothetical protein